MKAPLLLILLLALSQSTFAQHHRYRGYRGYSQPSFGFCLGVPYPWYPPPAYYYPPFAIYPPVVTIREPPAVYIEQDEVMAPPPVQNQQALEPGYWYYCRESGAYYPTVTRCPGQWQKVAPSNRQN